MPKVSIVCITYNQEEYIEEALKSFVVQKTNFPFEVIIADDCSIDRTPIIIDKYSKKYPNIIKPVLREENIGIVRNYIETLSLAKSEYVIVNEGDDYFCDIHKLQKQVDFLDSHLEYSACFHPVKIIYENNSGKTDVYPNKEIIKEKNVITLEDELKENYIQTNSIMYRWRFLNENIKDIFPKNILPCDWYLHLLHAQIGNIAYLKDSAMSVYRKHSNGVWADTMTNIDNLHSKYGIQELNMYKNVWENIANKSEIYKNEVFLPAFNSIFNTYIKKKKLKELKYIFNEYKDMISDSFIEYIYNQPVVLNDQCQHEQKKHKKYKRLFNTFLTSTIILFIILSLALVLLL